MKLKRHLKQFSKGLTVERLATQFKRPKTDEEDLPTFQFNQYKVRQNATQSDLKLEDPTVQSNQTLTKSEINEKQLPKESPSD